MTPQNNLRPPILLGNPTPSNQHPNRNLPARITSIIPLIDLISNAMIHITIPMQRLRFPPGPIWIATAAVTYGFDTDSLRVSPHQNVLRVVRSAVQRDWKRGFIAWGASPVFDFIVCLVEVRDGDEAADHHGAITSHKVDYVFEGSVGQVFIVDEKLQCVPGGQIGELVVGGVGVSGGYFRNPQRTSAGFISAKHLCAGKIYRTGDLVRRNAAGLVECLGRRDNEVKISGQRVELESVERCLLNTGLVWAAAALRVAEQQTGGVSTLVAYVVPRNGKVIDPASIAKALPLTDNGKVDRGQLAQHYKEDLESIMQGQRELSTHYESRESHLHHLWGEVLGMHPENIKQDDSFFSIGGTSLLVARLLARIKQTMNASIRVATLFECSTLKEMCEAVERSDMAGVEVKTVVCPVRAQVLSQARLRIQDAFRRFRLATTSEQEVKILALCGDVSKPSFGISQAQYAHFAAWCSVIFHLAAHVNFVEPYSSHRDSNVQGIFNILRFSEEARLKAVHYASSISAYGPTGLSKFAAEYIAWNAIDNGLPVTIHRLGYVLGHTNPERAIGALNSDDFLRRLVRACLHIGLYPSLPKIRKDLVAVDIAVSSMLHISSQTQQLAHAYNIVHPRERGISLSNLFQIVERHTKRPMQEAPYEAWIGALSQIPDNPLSSLMPMLEEPVWKGRSRWEMQEAMPEFETESLREVLRDSTILDECPSLGSLIESCARVWANQCGKLA
ncbi:hypothetical protein BJX68DRAFT_264671 [Aspergillus pseudodeflectus]|uniref:Carrier domain-containing protein n=1 Tax=Aspergillus pseudodeflectus TaxID=176178 RepID=A0ABR4KRW2_9EURO